MMNRTLDQSPSWHDVHAAYLKRRDELGSSIAALPVADFGGTPYKNISVAETIFPNGRPYNDASPWSELPADTTVSQIHIHNTTPEEIAAAPKELQMVIADLSLEDKQVSFMLELQRRTDHHEYRFGSRDPKKFNPYEKPFTMLIADWRSGDMGLLIASTPHYMGGAVQVWQNEGNGPFYNFHANPNTFELDNEKAKGLLRLYGQRQVGTAGLDKAFMIDILSASEKFVVDLMTSRIDQEALEKLRSPLPKGHHWG